MAHSHIGEEAPMLETLLKKPPHQMPCVRGRAATLPTSVNQARHIHHLHELGGPPAHVPAGLSSRERKKGAPLDNATVDALGLDCG